MKTVSSSFWISRRSTVSGSRQWRSCRTMSMCSSTRSRSSISPTCARRLFLLHPEMKEKLWGGHLWNPSYCVVTVSDRSRWRNISGARRKRPGTGRDVRRGIWKGSRDTTGKCPMQIMPCPGAEMPESSSSLKTTVTHPHDCGAGPCSGKDNSRKSDYPVLPHLHRRCP